MDKTGRRTAAHALRNKAMWRLLKHRMVPADPKLASAREPLVTVIIPALNEADSLGEVIAAVRSSGTSFEVIVVDAGSSDETAKIAASAGARVLQSFRRQRAYQLNLGAQQARGEILLFVHADTQLPPRALDQIGDALRNRRVIGGGFARRYASPSNVLRATCFLTRLRNRVLGWHLGDQAMFVRRYVFFQLGGFRDVERFEDLDLSRRMKSFGRVATLEPGVISSPRRFTQCGPARTTLRDFGSTIHYLVRGLPYRHSDAPSQSAAVYGATKSIGRL